MSSHSRLDGVAAPTAGTGPRPGRDERGAARENGQVHRQARSAHRRHQRHRPRRGEADHRRGRQRHPDRHERPPHRRGAGGDPDRAGPAQRRRRPRLGNRARRRAGWPAVGRAVAQRRLRRHRGDRRGAGGLLRPHGGHQRRAPFLQLAALGKHLVDGPWWSPPPQRPARDLPSRSCTPRPGVRWSPRSADGASALARPMRPRPSRSSCSRTMPAT
jgi:hypothetical protein